MVTTTNIACSQTGVHDTLTTYAVIYNGDTIEAKTLSGVDFYARYTDATRANKAPWTRLRNAIIVALLADTEICPIDLSLNLLDNLHQRWIILLRSMTVEEWERKLVHPEHKKEFSLKQFVALYAWHGKHHLAHIELAKKLK